MMDINKTSVGIIGTCGLIISVYSCNTRPYQGANVITNATAYSKCADEWYEKAEVVMQHCDSQLQQCERLHIRDSFYCQFHFDDYGRDAERKKECFQSIETMYKQCTSEILKGRRKMLENIISDIENCQSRFTEKNQ